MKTEVFWFKVMNEVMIKANWKWLGYHIVEPVLPNLFIDHIIFNWMKFFYC